MTRLKLKVTYFLIAPLFKMLFFTVFVNDLIADTALSCASVTLDCVLDSMGVRYHLFTVGTFQIWTGRFFTSSVHYFFLSPKHILALRFEAFDFFRINFLDFGGDTSNPSAFCISILRKYYSNHSLLTDLAQNVCCLRTFMPKMNWISLSF